MLYNKYEIVLYQLYKQLHKNGMISYFQGAECESTSEQ